MVSHFEIMRSLADQPREFPVNEVRRGEDRKMICFDFSGLNFSVDSFSRSRQGCRVVWPFRMRNALWFFMRGRDGGGRQNRKNDKPAAWLILGRFSFAWHTSLLAACLRGATFEFRRRPAQIPSPPAAKRREGGAGEWRPFL